LFFLEKYERAPAIFPPIPPEAYGKDLLLSMLVSRDEFCNNSALDFSIFSLAASSICLEMN
jgi:hypothetical protein